MSAMFDEAQVYEVRDGDVANQWVVKFKRPLELEDAKDEAITEGRLHVEHEYGDAFEDVDRPDSQFWVMLHALPSTVCLRCRDSEHACVCKQRYDRRTKVTEG